MRTGGGRDKGRNFENAVLKDLREIIAVTYKSLGSGSGDEKGDILTKCFCIECKFHKKLTDKQILTFWKKIVDEAIEQGKEPILIYKENNKEPRVMFFDKFRGTRRIEMWYSTWLNYLKENAGEVN